MAVSRIIFLNITSYDIEDGHETPATIVKDIIEFIYSLDDHTFDISDKKFCSLESLDTYESGNDTIQELCLKSARRGYRANLVDRETGKERPNPKQMHEGEKQKNHIIIKYKENEVLVCYEDRRAGTSTNQFLEWLQHYARAYHNSRKEQINYTLRAQIIANDNFVNEVNNLKRVKLGKVIISKKVLGGNFLGLTNRTYEVQDDISIDVKAKRNESIEGAVLDLYHKMTGKNNNIAKIVVEGMNEEKNLVKLDTDFIRKVEHIESDLDQNTGEIQTDSIMPRLRIIANQL